jgi:chromosome segregation ATPase
MFGKKKKEEGEEPEEEAPKEEAPQHTGEVSLGQLTADVEKLKAQFGTFYEINKASTERFSRINEQIGELRNMILDRDKESRVLEAKITQAIDMVQTVQPDKLMISVRKQDAKIEALRANIESNEIVIKNSMTEVRNIRNRMSMFTGVEQVMKLNEEVKGELTEVRKIDNNVKRHADKVDTIFSELQKTFNEFNRVIDNIKEMDKSVKNLASDLDSMKTRTSNFSMKKDLEEISVKFTGFEKHMENLISLFSKKLESMEKEMSNKIDEKTAKADKLLKGFETLAEKTPELDKYFNLLEKEATKAGADVAKIEKLKSLGEEEKKDQPAAEEEEEKKGIFANIFKKMKKKE